MWRSMHIRTPCKRGQCRHTFSTAGTAVLSSRPLLHDADADDGAGPPHRGHELSRSKSRDGGGDRRERADSHTAVGVTSGEVAPTLGPKDILCRRVQEHLVLQSTKLK